MTVRAVTAFLSTLVAIFLQPMCLQLRFWSPFSLGSLWARAATMPSPVLMSELACTRCPYSAPACVTVTVRRSCVSAQRFVVPSHAASGFFRLLRLQVGEPPGPLLLC